LLAAFVPQPALAQPTGSFSEFLPPPADTGKPRLFISPPALPREKLLSCPDGLSCRLSLLGEIRKGGAIELRAITFAW
jgi:hypothetical protein